MDALSDVLRSVRLEGGVFLDACFTAPWCVIASMNTEDCRPFVAGAVQLIAYHVVLEGKLLLSVDGEPPVEVGAGEIVLFPRNDAHLMGSSDGLEPLPARDLVQLSADGGLARIRYGGGGEATHLVCGFLASNETFNPLIATLPRVLTLDICRGLSRAWIEASVHFAANELVEGRLASSSVLSRLSETLFVEAVRQYASTMPDGSTGWLRGIKDPYIGRALSHIHQNLAAPWSTDLLAKEVALSRSAFVSRFKSVIGVPPIRYITICRLQAAKQQLEETSKPVNQLAHSVGYGSEEAFSRAFKREFGSSPQRWREKALAYPRSGAGP
ncbi:cupin domain-containing protein [Leptospira interrogans]